MGDGDSLPPRASNSESDQRLFMLSEKVDNHNGIRIEVF